MPNRLTVITGASAGVGRALATVFAQNGHDLLLVARSEDKLAQAAGELESRYGISCEYLAADLTDPDAPALVHDAATLGGRDVDVLVNNAGVLHEGAFTCVDLDRHLSLVSLNITATTSLAHLFLTTMLKQGRGRIVNLGSTSGFLPVPALATYAASKAYLLSFSEALWMETRGTGVSVTAACPGFTETEMISTHEGGSLRLPLVPNLSVEEVAAQTYEATMAGRPVLIIGAANRLTVGIFRHLPLPVRRIVLRQIARIGF